jgi:hypothetical protein
MRKTLLFLLMFFSAGLISCGGNSGGGDTPPPSGPVRSTLPFPPDAAVSRYLQAPQGFTITATDAANNIYTLTYSFTPGAPSTFEGTPANTASTSALIKENGVVFSTGSSVSYFNVSPYRPLGEYVVHVPTAPLPVTAMVGQSGAVSTSTAYANATKASVIWHSTMTWSLEADTASTAWFCMNETTLYTDGVTPNFTESDCYRVDVSGNVLGVKATITQAGIVLSFK